MPWCEPCGRFYNPNTLPADGTCPNCNTKLADADQPERTTTQKPPWHFWLLLVAVAVYLGWRIVQLVLLAV
jgi:hypothetical protein